MRAKGDAKTSNNLRKIAVKRTCGPEVGSALRATLYRVLHDFRDGWSQTGTAAEDEKHAACESLYNWNPVRIAEQYYEEKLRSVTEREEYYAWVSWDIVDFFTPNFVDGNLGATASKGCAAPYPCNVTVRIYGKCHKAWAVNYVLFGWMWRIASNGDPLRFYSRVGGSGGRPPRPTLGYPNSVKHVQRVLREARFSEDAMVTRISLWQQANAVKSDLKNALARPNTICPNTPK